MKSLKDYSLNLPEKDYHALDAWSYSLIAKYAKDGFSTISTLHEPSKQTDSMRFGSLFDSMLTKGKQTLDEFVVMDATVPDAEKKVLDVLSTITSDPYICVTDNDMQQAISISGYQPRWKYDTQRTHIDVFSDYYDKLRSGKTIVSSEDWNDAMEMYRIVKSHPVLQDHFRNGTHDGVEYIYQAQFMVDYETKFHGTVKLKIMPDMLEVDHNSKTVQPWDVKTSSMPSFGFDENFLKFRYDIQASLYTDVLRMVMQNDEDYKDYRILPYLFMDISRSDKVPSTFIYDPQSIDQTGGLCFSKGDHVYQYKGWEDLLEEILEYEQTNAKVPSYISLTEPNSIIDLLSRR